MSSRDALSNLAGMGLDSSKGGLSSISRSNSTTPMLHNGGRPPTPASSMLPHMSDKRGKQAPVSEAPPLPFTPFRGLTDELARYASIEATLAVPSPLLAQQKEDRRLELQALENNNTSASSSRHPSIIRRRAESADPGRSSVTLMETSGMSDEDIQREHVRRRTRRNTSIVGRAFETTQKKQRGTKYSVDIPCDPKANRMARGLQSSLQAASLDPTLVDRVGERREMRTQIGNGPERFRPAYELPRLIQQEQIGDEVDVAAESNKLIDSKSSVAELLHRHHDNLSIRQGVEGDLDEWTLQVGHNDEIATDTEARLMEMEQDEDLGRRGEAAVHGGVSDLQHGVLAMNSLKRNIGEAVQQANMISPMMRRAKFKTTGTVTTLSFYSGLGQDPLEETDSGVLVSSSTVAGSQSGIQRQPTLGTSDATLTASQKPGSEQSVVFVEDNSETAVRRMLQGDAADELKRMKKDHAEAALALEEKISRRNESIMNLMKLLETRDRVAKRRIAAAKTVSATREQENMQLRIYLDAIQSGQGFTHLWDLEEEENDVARFLKEAMKQALSDAQEELKNAINSEDASVEMEKQRVQSLDDNVPTQGQLKERVEHRKELRELKEQIRQLKLECDRKDEAIQDRQEKILEVEEKLLVSERRKGSLKEEISELRGRITTLESESSLWRKKHDELLERYDVDTLKAKEAHSSDLDDMRRQIAELHAEVERTEKATESKAMMKQAHIVGRNKELEDQIKNLKELNRAHDQRVQDLESQLGEVVSVSGTFAYAVSQALRSLRSQTQGFTLERDLEAMRQVVWNATYNALRDVLSLCTGLFVFAEREPLLPQARKEAELMMKENLEPTREDQRRQQLESELEKMRELQHDTLMKFRMMSEEVEKERARRRETMAAIQAAVAAIFKRKPGEEGRKENTSTAPTFSPDDVLNRELQGIFEQGVAALDISHNDHHQALVDAVEESATVQQKIIDICDETSEPVYQLLGVASNMCQVMRQASGMVAGSVVAPVKKWLTETIRETDPSDTAAMDQNAAARALLEEVTVHIPQQNTQLILTAVRTRIRYKTRLMMYKRDIQRKLNEGLRSADDAANAALLRRRMNHVERKMYHDFRELYTEFVDLHGRRMRALLRLDTQAKLGLRAIESAKDLRRSPGSTFRLNELLSKRTPTQQDLFSSEAGSSPSAPSPFTQMLETTTRSRGGSMRRLSSQSSRRGSGNVSILDSQGVDGEGSVSRRNSLSRSAPGSARDSFLDQSPGSSLSPQQNSVSPPIPTQRRGTLDPSTAGTRGAPMSTSSTPVLATSEPPPLQSVIAPPTGGGSVAITSSGTVFAVPNAPVSHVAVPADAAPPSFYESVLSASLASVETAVKQAVSDLSSSRIHRRPTDSDKADGTRAAQPLADAKASQFPEPQMPRRTSGDEPLIPTMGATSSDAAFATSFEGAIATAGENNKLLAIVNKAKDSVAAIDASLRSAVASAVSHAVVVEKEMPVQSGSRDTLEASGRSLSREDSHKGQSTTKAEAQGAPARAVIQQRRRSEVSISSEKGAGTPSMVSLAEQPHTATPRDLTEERPHTVEEEAEKKAAEAIQLESAAGMQMQKIKAELANVRQRNEKLERLVELSRQQLKRMMDAGISAGYGRSPGGESLDPFDATPGRQSHTGRSRRGSGAAENMYGISNIRRMSQSGMVVTDRTRVEPGSRLGQDQLEEHNKRMALASRRSSTKRSGTMENDDSITDDARSISMLSVPRWPATGKSGASLAEFHDLAERRVQEEIERAAETERQIAEAEEGRREAEEAAAALMAELEAARSVKPYVIQEHPMNRYRGQGTEYAGSTTMGGTQRHSHVRLEDIDWGLDDEEAKSKIPPASVLLDKLWEEDKSRNKKTPTATIGTQTDEMLLIDFILALVLGHQRQQRLKQEQRGLHVPSGIRAAAHTPDPSVPGAPLLRGPSTPAVQEASLRTLPTPINQPHNNLQYRDLRRTLTDFMAQGKKLMELRSRQRVEAEGPPGQTTPIPQHMLTANASGQLPFGRPASAPLALVNIPPVFEAPTGLHVPDSAENVGAVAMPIASAAFGHPGDSAPRELPVNLYDPSRHSTDRGNATAVGDVYASIAEFFQAETLQRQLLAGILEENAESVSGGGGSKKRGSSASKGSATTAKKGGKRATSAMSVRTGVSGISEVASNASTIATAERKAMSVRSVLNERPVSTRASQRSKAKPTLHRLQSQTTGVVSGGGGPTRLRRAATPGGRDSQQNAFRHLPKNLRPEVDVENNLHSTTSGDGTIGMPRPSQSSTAEYRRVATRMSASNDVMNVSGDARPPPASPSLSAEKVDWDPPRSPSPTGTNRGPSGIMITASPPLPLHKQHDKSPQLPIHPISPVVLVGSVDGSTGKSKPRVTASRTSTRTVVGPKLQRAPTGDPIPDPS